MAVTVTLLQFTEIPAVMWSGSVQPFGVAQFYGPMIADETWSLSGTGNKALNSAAKYFTVVAHNATVMFDTAATNATPLSANRGMPVFSGVGITKLREASHAFVLLREFGT